MDSNVETTGKQPLLESAEEPVVAEPVYSPEHPKKAKSNISTYVVAACIIALVALSFLGALMNVGDHLDGIHPALGWTFYGIIIVLVIAGIIVPLISVARRPIFSLYQLHDEKGHAKKRRCKMLVENLVENCDLTKEEEKELESILQKGDEADDLLIDYFSSHIVPRIDEETNKAATTAFFVSAVSHSPLISTVTMLSVCFDLVRAIVEQCGFRPTNMGLARLYSRVMLSALIVGGIEDADLSDLIGQLLGGGAGARAGGLLIGSATDGIVSAFLVFRVGVITKRWLTAADGPAQMRRLRRTSYKEALNLMKESNFTATVAEMLKNVSGSVAHSVTSKVSSAAGRAAEQAKSIFSF